MSRLGEYWCQDESTKNADWTKEKAGIMSEFRHTVESLCGEPHARFLWVHCIFKACRWVTADLVATRYNVATGRAWQSVAILLHRKNGTIFHARRLSGTMVPVMCVILLSTNWTNQSSYPQTFSLDTRNIWNVRWFDWSANGGTSDRLNFFTEGFPNRAREPVGWRQKSTYCKTLHGWARSTVAVAIKRTTGVFYAITTKFKGPFSVFCN